MATINQVLDNVRATNTVIQGVVVSIIEDHSDIIAGYNREQLNYGKDRNEEDLAPEYASLLYAIEKNNQNPNAGMFIPDLFLTGAFYGGFFLSVNGFAFEISSTDSKTPDLVAKYTPNIFGLNPTSMGEYAKNEFFEEFKKFIENTLKLTMK